MPSLPAAALRKYLSRTGVRTNVMLRPFVLDAGVHEAPGEGHVRGGV